MVDEHIVSGRSMEVRAVGAAGTTGAASPAAMQTSAPAAAGAGTALAGAPSLAVLFSSGQFARVAITDRLNCTRPLPDQVERLAGKVDALVLREKDLAPDAYERLARHVGPAVERPPRARLAHTVCEPPRRPAAWGGGRGGVVAQKFQNSPGGGDGSNTPISQMVPLRPRE